MYIYIYIHTYMYVSMYTCIYVDIYTYVYMYINIHIYIYIYIYINIYVYMHICMYVYIFMYLWIFYIHTHPSLHTHIPYFLYMIFGNDFLAPKYLHDPPVLPGPRLVKKTHVCTHEHTQAHRLLKMTDKIHQAWLIRHFATCCNTVLCCISVLLCCNSQKDSHRVAVCCSVLQCFAVCCIVFSLL